MIPVSTECARSDRDCKDCSMSGQCHCDCHRVPGVPGKRHMIKDASGRSLCGVARPSFSTDDPVLVSCRNCIPLF